jgi:LacI family transcriptional regulator
MHVGSTSVANRKVTVRDVARHTGLSVASVSRALSGSRPVTAEVAEIVLAAAEELGYQPDHLARALSVGRTSTVGLVVPDITTPFFSMLADAVERVLRKEGLAMLLMNAQNDPEWERECVELLLARRIDGLMISPTHQAKSARTVQEAASRLPVVQIDRYATAKVTRIITDPLQTIALSVDHLREQGRSTFAFVGAESSASTAATRLRAYERLMADDPNGSAARVLTGRFTTDWGYECSGVIVERWPDVDAVICANDLIALGVIQGFQALRRDVPTDVAVTGCDDTLFSAISRPTVTSVAQPLAGLAEAALEALQGQSQDETTKLVSLAPTLHIRGSSVTQRRRRTRTSMPDKRSFNGAAGHRSLASGKARASAPDE